jgi:succinate dehydrogenase/fumarate reductase cytochrome b subunit
MKHTVCAVDLALMLLATVLAVLNGFGVLMWLCGAGPEQLGAEPRSFVIWFMCSCAGLALLIINVAAVWDNDA